MTRCARAPSRRSYGSGRRAAARRLTVDLSRLHFLSVGCAVSLLRPARGAAGHGLIEVRCDRGQCRLLHRLGAGTVPRLVLTEVVRAW